MHSIHEIFLSSPVRMIGVGVGLAMSTKQCAQFLKVQELVLYNPTGSLSGNFTASMSQILD